MGDMGDMYREMNRLRKEKRQRNMKDSNTFLVAKGINFRTNNGGAHLIINEPNTGPIDFWPSTGLWIPRNTKKKSRGVQNLITYILGDSNDG